MRGEARLGSQRGVVRNEDIFPTLPPHDLDVVVDAVHRERFVIARPRLGELHLMRLPRIPETELPRAPLLRGLGF